MYCIVAPYKADAQLAYLSKIGAAQIIITEDLGLGRDFQTVMRFSYRRQKYLLVPRQIKYCYFQTPNSSIAAPTESCDNKKKINFVFMPINFYFGGYFPWIQDGGQDPCQKDDSK